MFKLADIPGNRHVVQVFDKDEKKIYTTMLAVPNQRMKPSDKPIVLFSERASGSPQAVKVWYYPGETIGNEFVYPKSQAMKIAKETHTRVLATNDEPKSSATTAGEIPVEMKTAAVGYFDENGNWQSEAEQAGRDVERAGCNGQGRDDPGADDGEGGHRGHDRQPSGAQAPAAHVEQPRAVRAAQRALAGRRLRRPRRFAQRLS